MWARFERIIKEARKTSVWMDVRNRDLKKCAGKPHRFLRKSLGFVANKMLVLKVSVFYKLQCFQDLAFKFCFLLNWFFYFFSQLLITRNMNLLSLDNSFMKKYEWCSSYLCYINFLNGKYSEDKSLQGNSWKL